MIHIVLRTMLLVFPLLCTNRAHNYNWVEVLDAIYQLESGGPCLDGDGGKAIGPYQIHRAYWIDGTKFLQVKWPYSDARDFKRARIVTYAYLRHYGSNLPPIEAARCHNGGPRGYVMKSTLSYQAKLLKILE